MQSVFASRRGPSRAIVLLSVLAVFAVALVVGVGASRADVYWSGSAPPTTQIWAAGWNYWHYNQAFNCWCNGPLVRVMEHHTDGSWVYTYSGNGEVDICHNGTGDYTEAGCENLTSSWIALVCTRATGVC